MDFDELINEVTQLSDKDQRKLYLFLGQTVSNPVESQSKDHVDRLYNLIVALLKQRGIYKCPPLSRVLQVTPQFKEDSEIFLRFAKKYGTGTKKVERIKIINMLLGMVYIKAQAQNDLVTFWNYAKLLPYINQIFDKAYPGYAQAGIADLVFNAVLGDRTNGE